MTSTFSNALLGLQSVEREAEKAITPDFVRSVRLGEVALLQEKEDSTERKQTQSALDDEEGEEEFERRKLLKAYGNEDVSMSEASSGGSDISEENLDSHRRPYIDPTKFQLGDTKKFDDIFQLPNTTKKRDQGPKKNVTIRVPQGLLTHNAIDQWIQFIPVAMNALISIWPKDIANSDYPHIRWAGNLASKMVMHYFPKEVDHLLLGWSTIRNNPPDKLQRPELLVAPTVSFYRPQAKDYIPVQISLPRGTPVYPGHRELKITRALVSFRQDPPPSTPSLHSTIFRTLHLNQEAVDDAQAFYTEEQRDLVNRAYDWCQWLCYQVASKGRYGLSYKEWLSLFNEFMPTCLRDNLQSQQRHLSNRWFTVHKVPGEDRRFRLIALNSGFSNTEGYSITSLSIYLKGMSATEAGKFSVWLNERYAVNRDVLLTLKEFALHVDTSRGFAHVWQNATDCTHQMLDGSHLCVVCEVNQVPCLELIPGKGAMCGDCLQEADAKSSSEYLDVYHALRSIKAEDNANSAVLHSAVSKHRSYDYRMRRLKTRGYLESSSVADLRSTVTSWSDDDGEIQDAVLGLGGLHEASQRGGFDNILLRPSVARKTRAYVDVELKTTYLFHHRNILPTVGAVGVMSSVNSLAATALILEAGCIKQTRWEDLIAKKPDPHGEDIRRRMKQINNELRNLHIIQAQIPYRISDIAGVNPKELKEPIDSMIHSLQQLGISSSST